MKPLAPGSRIGILGGGQLGRMLALAAAPLGYRCHIFAPEAETPAGAVAERSTRAAYDDIAALSRFAAEIDVATYEFENIPAEPVAALAELVPVRPGVDALRIAQDRLFEKDYCHRQGAETAPFHPVQSLDDLKAAIAKLGLPLILKTRRMGYDGKGQQRIDRADQAEAAFHALKSDLLIAEGFVPFERELSVVLARGMDGSIASFGPVENVHEHHILRRSFAPARIDAALATEAENVARRLIGGLDYVGVLAVEMFALKDGIKVNELAPRVHNSGHWTLDASLTSQFEQHIRAIAGLPLGEPDRHSDAVMENLIGSEIERWPELAAEPATKLHHYGKTEARPGRKMGHITRLFPLGGLKSGLGAPSKG